MMEGYFGKLLRVDLEKGKIERFTVTETVLRKFIGGTGLS